MPPDAPTRPCRIVATDWLYHRLTVSGLAAGAGVVPWRLDFATIEEDLFHQLVAGCPRPRLSLDGCRAFAAQLRETIKDRQTRALTRVGVSRACPSDLHALLPVPQPMLGPDDPRAEDWRRTHWETLELRHVGHLPGRAYLPPGPLRVPFGFFAADCSPWAELQRLRTLWPDLRLDLQPVYKRD